MKQPPSLKVFLAEYFPAFIVAFFMVCFSASCTVALASNTYFKGIEDRVFKTSMVLLALSVVVFVSHFLMVRGRAWAVWVVVGLFVACLVTVLPSYGYRPHMFVYSTGLLFPLIGLLILNSKLHREMRAYLAEMRKERVKQRDEARAIKERR